MSRAIDVNQWLEEWCREEGFTFRKQWESLRKEFRLLFLRSVEGGEGIKEGTDEVLVMSKARQENRILGREKLNIVTVVEIHRTPFRFPRGQLFR